MREKTFLERKKLSLPEPVRPLKKTRLGMQLSIFDSVKNEKKLHLESSIELDYAHLLEWRVDVLYFVPQPLVVRIFHEGRFKDYVPDFFHIDRRHNRFITEIKPFGWNESPSLVDKYEQVRFEISRIGMQFNVVTDEDLRTNDLISNLRYLYPFFKKTNPAEQLAVINGLKRLGGAGTVSQLLSLDPAPSYQSLAAFAYTKWIDIDNQPFSKNSRFDILV